MYAVNTGTDHTLERATAHLLGVQSDNERGNVDHLLSDTDVPLPDEDTGVVDGLGETRDQSITIPPVNPSLLA